MSKETPGKNQRGQYQRDDSNIKDAILALCNALRLIITDLEESGIHREAITSARKEADYAATMMNMTDVGTKHE